MWQKVITILMGLAIVGGLAWYVNASYVNPTTREVNTKAAKPDQVRGTQNQEAVRPALIYLKKGTSTEIWSYQGGESKKLFTDADEPLKISKVSNLSNSGTVLAYVKSGENAGKLISINLTTAKEKTLKESFSLNSNITLSTDGSRYAYTRFSNVESDYGYTLYLENIETGKITEAFRNETDLISPSFNGAADSLVYGKLNGESAQIFVYNLKENKSKQIASFENKTIDFINWSSENKIIYTLRNTDADSDNEIDSCTASGSAIDRIYRSSGSLANFAFLDEQSNSLAFIVAQYGKAITSATSGQIYILDTETNEKKSIEKGNQILGYLE